MADPTPPAPAEPVSEKKVAVLTDEELAALKACNEHVERDGVFSDGLRTF